jgi:hypothetical protein
LRDPVPVGWIHAGQAAQGAAALGVFALGQMSPAGAGAQDFPAGRDLETLGHGLLRFDTFGSSHKIFIAKERKLYAGEGFEASDFYGKFSGERIRAQFPESACVPLGAGSAAAAS